jgi:tetratricopeptide (TPR) repeat protein
VALDDKQKSLIHSEMGTLYFWLGDYETADRQCENALAYGFDNDQAYVILGRIAVARFQFSIANGYFSKISDNNPEKNFGFCLVAIKTRDTKSASSYLSSVAKMISKNDKQYRVYF